MKRLITVLASIALLGTLFVGAPKPVFASVTEIYYIGANGPSDTGCGRPDIQVSTDEFIDGDYDGGLRDNYDDVYYDDMDYALQWALTLVDDGDIIQLCDTFETHGDDTDYWYFTNTVAEWNGDQNASPSLVDPIDLTIQGLGPDETILNGDGWRMFNFTNVNLTLKDMSLYNGHAEGQGGGENGGAVRLIGGSLTVENVDFTAFSAGDSGDGQFIYVEGADLTVDDSSFEQESWYYLSELNEGNGGAIYSTSDNTTGANTTISIDNTLFDDLGTQDVGGAIYAYCADMTISNSQFRDNTAGIAGGAIYAYGGDESCESTGSLTINEGTLFTQNHIHEDFGGEGGMGGAIYSEGQPVTIADSDFGQINNDGVYDGNWNNDGNGGALYVDGTSGTALTITDSKFFDNSSGWDTGGAIYASCANVSIVGDSEGNELNDWEDGAFDETVSTKFIGNYASNEAGALYLDAEDCNDDNGDGSGINEYVDASIDGVRFLDNSSGNQGGAIATNQSGFNWLESLSVNSSVFLQNRSYDSDGGAINSDYVDVSVTDSTFVNNRAQGGGVAELCSANIDIMGSTFINNWAWGFQGGVILVGGSCDRNANNISISGSLFGGNYAEGDGGVIWAENGSLITIEGSYFIDNTSGNGGGAAWIDDAAVEISNSIFYGNQAYQEGGALDFDVEDADGGNSLVISNSTFQDNSSGAFGGGDSDGSSYGGAIDFEPYESGDVYLGVFDSVFDGNYAPANDPEDGQGGAIWMSSGDAGTLDIRRSRFVDNTAEGEGGGLYVGLGEGGTLLIDRTTFTGNTAWLDGGAINQDSYDSFTFVRITNSTFTDNSAGSDGGALDLTDRAVLTNNTFVGNNATLGDAGAVELNQDNEDDPLPYLFTVTGNTFRLNTAGVSNDTGQGGALSSEGPALITSNTFISNAAYGGNGEGGAIDSTNEANSNVTTISKNVFTGNFAEDDGGAIYASDKVVIASNTFTSNTTNDDGGAVYASYWHTVITKNTFTRNFALESGGALRASNLGFPYSSVTDNLFDSNRAGGNGGAMAIDDAEGSQDHKVVIASNRIIRNTAQDGAGIYVTYPDGSASPTQLMSGIIRNTFERNIASQNGGAIMMEYRGGAYSNARAALQELKKAVKNNRYKGNKANLDRATGDIGGVAINFEVGSAEAEVAEVRLPEAPKAR